MENLWDAAVFRDAAIPEMSEEGKKDGKNPDFHCNKMIKKSKAAPFPTIDVEQFGRKLRELCEIRGVSVQELREYLNLTSVQAVYLWFGGKRLPSIDNMYAISCFLGVSMDELVDSARLEQAQKILMDETLQAHEKRIFFYWEKMAKKRENAGIGEIRQ